MRKLKIATGTSRASIKWKNREITFDEICKQLKDTMRTPETLAEYKGASKSEQSNIKDKGGFVAGELLQGRRKRENVSLRSMLVYDLDDIPKGFLDTLPDHIPNTACYYTTHSHTPDAPRARVIVPLTRDVTPDEFNAVSRYYAYDHQFIDTLDPCCFQPQQLMYWPTTSQDGEYLFDVLDGDWLDPDEILNKHPHWRDITLLPMTSRETEIREYAQKHQEDPLKKKGIVGAACRAYSIQDVISKYLSDVYTPVDDDHTRYSYLKGEGSAGLVIYDNKFAYSHHATDPAGEQLCNAFDLVRVHKFGDLPEKDSYDKASELFSNDNRVKRLVDKEKRKDAENDFAEADNAEEEENDDWMMELEREKKTGEVKNTLHNLAEILKNDRRLQDIAFNELSGCIEIRGKVPWFHPENHIWRDADDSQLTIYLNENYCTFSKQSILDALTKAADDRSFHPLRDYLNQLPEWDGIERIDTLLPKYLGAEDSEYVHAVTRKTLCAAVARAEVPGTKFDYILVLNGDQGIGKSTLVSKLGGEWYSDSLSLTDMNDKTAAEKLQGYWIMEISELAGMRKADIDRVKAFISRQDDKYRPAFGRRVLPHKRQCIFFGTTNTSDGFLRDVTGNRRFWIVQVSGDGKYKPWDLDQEDVDQIWAEAKEIWESGKEKLQLSAELEKVAAEKQNAAIEQDDRVGMIEAYLNIPITEDWNERDMDSKRTYLRDYGSDEIAEVGQIDHTATCSAQILCECFGRDKGSIKKTEYWEIHQLMMHLTDWKYTNKQIEFGYPYGRQRAYMRKHSCGGNISENHATTSASTSQSDEVVAEENATT